MAANFNDGKVAGKCNMAQHGGFRPKDGIEKQLNVLSNFGLLSRFVGMITDSSFLSFQDMSILGGYCNVLGKKSKGELLNDMELIPIWWKPFAKMLKLF
jgi:glucuronate isomerase